MMQQTHLKTLWDTLDTYSEDELSHDGLHIYNILKASNNTLSFTTNFRFIEKDGACTAVSMESLRERQYEMVISVDGIFNLTTLPNRSIVIPPEIGALSIVLKLLILAY